MITKPAPKPGEQKKRKPELSQGERHLAGLLVKRRKVARQLAEINREIEEVVSDYEASDLVAE